MVMDRWRGGGLGDRLPDWLYAGLPASPRVGAKRLSGRGDGSSAWLLFRCNHVVLTANQPIAPSWKAGLTARQLQSLRTWHAATGAHGRNFLS